MEINNRELATVLWLVGFLSFMAYRSPDVRASMLALLAAVFQWKLVALFGVFSAYLAAATYSIDTIGLWSWSASKTVVMWFVFAGSIAIGRVIARHDDPDLFRRLVRDAVAVAVVIEYLVGFHSFNLFVELLFVPATAALGGMMAVAERGEEYKPARRFLNGVATALGLFLIVRSLVLMWSEPSQTIQWQTAIDLGLPIVLLFVSLPFFMALSVYVAYEQLSITRMLKMTKWWLRYYFLAKTCWRIGWSREKLKSWTEFQRRFVMNSVGDVDEVFDAYEAKISL